MRVVVMLCLGCLACAPAASPPVTFSNVRVEELTATRAVLRFTTSQPTSCRALFGTSAATLERSATDPNMAPGTLVTDHTVPLEDLTPATPWYWRAEATDRDGRVFLSDLRDFTTPAGNGVGGTLVNVALLSLGTTVTAVSSNFGGGGVDTGFGANNALDGAMATEWSTNGDGNGAWVELDLGAPRAIQGVGFRSRKMTDGTSIIRAFRMRLDDGVWRGPFDTPNPDEAYRFDLDVTATTRTVRLEATDTSGGNTGAKEIELYAAPP